MIPIIHKPVMEMLVAKGKVIRGYLGVGLEPMSDELARHQQGIHSRALPRPAGVHPGAAGW